MPEVREKAGDRKKIDRASSEGKRAGDRGRVDGARSEVKKGGDREGRACQK